VLQQSAAKAGSSLVVVPGNVADDLGEIGQRPLREEEAVIHWGKSLRTSSMETVRPAPASRIPSSIAARVSSSSSSGMGGGSSKSSLVSSAQPHSFNSSHSALAQTHTMTEPSRNRSGAAITSRRVPANSAGIHSQRSAATGSSLLALRAGI